MADENVSTPAPTRSDDQILPFAAAFTALASVPAIYIQQFWNTLTYVEKAGTYRFQLDEDWFTLDANLLREALEITPIDQAHPFVSPPSGDAIMDFVNELGYPEVIHFVSSMAVNHLYQPWRAILSMINQCLTGKTSGHDRPRYPVLQMLWGIITNTNVDYAELMWEEFVQAMQTFLTDKANLGSPTKKGRKDKPHVIPYCRFTKLIICHLGRIHNIHQRSASPFHLAEEDLRLGNLKFVSKGEIPFDRGYVAFGGGAYGGKILGKGTLKTANLDFEDVYFVNELKFNLFSVSQMCDKKNYVLFTDIECLVLSPNFKLLDENQILLKVPRKDNMYSFDTKNIVPKESLTCLVAKATLDKSMLWNRRLGHINFKNINKLVKDNLVRGLPIKRFEITKLVLLVLKGSNTELLQNGVAERRNRTLIEAARTMLADSKLPTTFWAEAVSTACYVQNRVLVVKPHNKTPYELFRGFKPALSFMRPFGCHVTILNTLDSLGKFDGKSDEGFFVGYSLSSKAFRVYNTRTKRVEENLHIGFLENKPMIEGTGPKWLFDIDSLTQSMNYVPVTAGTVSNDSAGTSEENSQDCIVMPIWKDTSYFDSPTKNVDNGEPKTADDAQKQVEDGLNNKNAEQERFADDSSSKDVNAIGQQVNTASPDVNIGSLKLNVVGPSVSTSSPNEEDNTKEELEVDLGNITNSYIIPTTPNTRIHKDHPIDNVIGEVQSTVQTK
ncbi:putative ribonuclease H-like domain-containing protein [Tanacetum coccineum]